MNPGSAAVTYASFEDKDYVKDSVTLDNGVTVTVEYSESEDYIRVTADNGEKYEASLTEFRKAAMNSASGFRSTNFDRPNSCEVATGISGLSQSAVWGGAVGAVAGGPAGLAASLGVGAFWWLIGTQC